MPDAGPATDPAAILAGIRERFGTVTGIPLEALPLAPEQAAAFAAMVMDIPALLAAVEAVLKQADEWAAEAKRIDGIFAEDEDPWPRTVGGMRAEAFESCAAKAREAIRAALTGKEAGDA